MIKPRHLLSVLCASATMLITSSNYAAETTAASCKFPISINTATAKDFQCLPGVGERLGNRIIEDRQKKGGSFKSVDDLNTVKGISDKRLTEWKNANQVILK